MLVHFLQFVLETLVDAKSPLARRRLWLALVTFLAANAALFTAIGLAARGMYVAGGFSMLAMIVLVLASALLFIAAIVAEYRRVGETDLPSWPLWLLGAAIVLVPPPLLLVGLGGIWIYMRLRPKTRGGVKERM